MAYIITSDSPREQRYTVHTMYRSGNECREDVRTVYATSPDEAMTIVERSGVDYHEAMIEDRDGNQVALYGPDEDGPTDDETGQRMM